MELVPNLRPPRGRGSARAGGERAPHCFYGLPARGARGPAAIAREHRPLSRHPALRPFREQRPVTAASAVRAFALDPGHDGGADLPDSGLERHEPLPGADSNTRTRDVSPRLHRRRPRPFDPAGAHRKRHAGDSGVRCRPGHRQRRRAGHHQPPRLHQRPALSRPGHQLARGGICRLADRDCHGALRTGAGAARVARRADDRAEVLRRSNGQRPEQVHAAIRHGADCVRHDRIVRRRPADAVVRASITSQSRLCLGRRPAADARFIAQGRDRATTGSNIRSARSPARHAWRRGRRSRRVQHAWPGVDAHVSSAGNAIRWHRGEHEAGQRRLLRSDVHPPDRRPQLHTARHRQRSVGEHHRQ